ncbi:hypothetical protein BRADI_1g71720v3 [Brachypodium distachyon]|uniref:Carboxypeptidase n=1 Tax=Brachypodium distachyon TaxID=15368 RepID=I1H8Q1_BRADI|nr:hypothetical protein BRADI_1g71720v3 [Brachypodium distachyon]
MGKLLFYYFVEAPANPAHKPLVLWLNGGKKAWPLLLWDWSVPGDWTLSCRHRQQDPLLKQIRLDHRRFATARLPFLQMPMGVGFSYEVYETMGDNITAADSLFFLLRWFDRFTEYKGRDFFIVGESCVGHYVPKLAAIGSGILEYAEEQAELYEYLWQRTFVSDSTHTMIAQHCKISDDPSTVCQTTRVMAYDNIGDISAYNIYASTCHDKKVTATDPKCMV